MDDFIDDETPFAVSFPLPFRVLFLVGLGILGWAANLHGLTLLGVDVSSAFGLSIHAGHTTPLPTDRQAGSRFTSFHGPMYRLFISYSTWCFLAWSIFRFSAGNDPMLVDVFKYIPGIACLGVLLLVICPFNVCQKRERDAFLLSLRRCITPPSHRQTYFCDIVFADILTSFAKVVGDIWLSLCMLWPGGSLLELPTQSGLSRWVLPILMSLPYAVRLRQCLIDYYIPGNESRRPLYNALKYATSFPVIFLSAAQRIVVTELVAEKGEKVANEAWHGEHQLFRLWLLSALVNSLYSFWWDLTNDWGLDLLKIQSSENRSARVPRPLILPSLHSRSESITSNTASSSSSGREDGSDRPWLSPRQNQAYPNGLRPTLLYPLPVYPLIIFLNLVLRLTWSIKLSSHLHFYTEGSVVIFWLEMAELFRRWMWVFVRVEWEVVRRTEEAGYKAGGSYDAEEYELLSPNEEQSKPES
ncbi:EXS-domain-containing protein [Gloeophyllum trabeum ATCC 11539]|uniref:EXS-domain-containing protein n=1 Tax=Gloeophyllum trabeum (strain ATCC 11539 / FP-39264 / Madison 617) TaxID=670483 RepID=S7QBI7_GLOTA|nr:EXS-domain-containing protein [Gloeophyllum trabeum ATCC 11539]EPQ57321.1 EXS-domain-containing protein [Gloeophyllum trabeum ATCC 11539]